MTNQCANATTTGGYDWRHKKRRGDGAKKGSSKRVTWINSFSKSSRKSSRKSSSSKKRSKQTRKTYRK